MGNRQSMAVLKVGDWVLIRGEGVGKITLMNFTKSYHLVDLLDGTSNFAVLRNQNNMTLIDPAFTKLLTNINKEKNDG
jgi:hypothetical protein